MHFNFTLSTERIAFVLSFALALFIIQTVQAQKAYIPNLLDNTVSVIDLTTNMVTTTVDVGTNPICVATNTASNKVYIGNRNSNNLSVINPTTDEVETTIDIGGSVRGIAVNSMGTRAYVGDVTNDAIKVVNLSTNMVETTIPISGDAIEVAISPDGTKVLVSNGNVVTIINAATDIVDTNISMIFPYEIAFNSTSTKAYVAEINGNRVSEIDMATNTSTVLVSGIFGAEGIAITPDDATLYVAGTDVRVVDIATAMVTASIVVGSDPESIEIDPSGQKAYTTNYGSDNVSVIDLATNTVETTIAVGEEPLAIGNFILGELSTLVTTVTFQVDASNLVDAGELSADGIYLAGSFNSFNGEPMTEGTDNIWTLTLEIETGSTHTYKFQNGPGGWENIDVSFGEDCTVNTFGDRQVVVGDMPMTTDLVCFAYCVECTVVDVDEASLEAGIQLFPNPTAGVIYLDQLDVEKIEVYNEQGQLVFTQSQVGQQVDIGILPTGMYFFKGINAERMYIGRVVKK